MTWELEGFSLDPANGLARFTFRSQTSSSAETPEQRLIQVLNEIEMALVG